MEIESLSGIKFGIVECGPKQDGFLSDGMSSDATVLCIDSDAEYETQSQDGIDPGLESRLKEKGLQSIQENKMPLKSATLISEGPGNTIGLSPKDLNTVCEGSEKVLGKASTIGELKDVVSYVTNRKVSWGREQELADSAAAALLAVGSKKTHEIAATGALVVENNCKDTASNQRKKRGGKNKRNTTAWRQTDDFAKNEIFKEHETATVLTKQLIPQRGRRRGRRGGRGRKQVDTDRMEIVPKLEKNLEEELAEQLANQASNDSALSMGFSSLRLHVPGGNTMIILNDHELKDGITADDILSKIESDCAVQEDEPLDSVTTGSGQRFAAVDKDRIKNVNAGGAAFPAVAACHQKTPSKGCGAFFPPSLLKNLNDGFTAGSKHTHHQTYAGNSDCTHSTQKLNVGASPFMPFASFSMNDYRSVVTQPFGAMEKEACLLNDDASEQAMLSQPLRSGTGCFIPLYSHDAVIREEESSNVFVAHPARMSLADSLSSIDDVSFSMRRNRLRLQPPEPDKVPEEDEQKVVEYEDEPAEESQHEIKEQGSSAEIITNVGCAEGEHGLVIVGELSPAKEPKNPGEELLHLLEGNNFTSFTSPLHLEETLDGLEEEVKARITAEGRVLELESENGRLRNEIRMITFLQEEFSKLQGFANTLQVLLFVVVTNPDSIHMGIIPKGMFRHAHQLEASELAAVRSELASKSAEFMEIQKELGKKNAELKALSECWLCCTGGKKTSSRTPSMTVMGKKQTTKTLPSDISGSSNVARRARSASFSDLKLTQTKASHKRTMSTNSAGVSKTTVPRGMPGHEPTRRVTSVKSRVTEVTKTTTTTKLVAVSEEMTEETTMTEERKSVKKVVLPYHPAAEKKREAAKRLWR